MNGTPIRIVALLALVAAACVPPPVRRVNRAALVPRLTPSLGDGAPMAQPVELAFGAASLAAGAPGPGDGDAALEVPGTQLAGSVRFRFADYASIGFGYAAGLDASAQPIRPHQAPVDGEGHRARRRRRLGRRRDRAGRVAGPSASAQVVVTRQPCPPRARVARSAARAAPRAVTPRASEARAAVRCAVGRRTARPSSRRRSSTAIGTGGSAR
jgi:hypothetical protein